MAPDTHKSDAQRAQLEAQCPTRAARGAACLAHSLSRPTSFAILWGVLCMCDRCINAHLQGVAEYEVWPGGVRQLRHLQVLRAGAQHVAAAAGTRPVIGGLGLVG